MDDLRRALASLDSLQAPDIWSEIERRAAAPESATLRGTGRFQAMFSATRLVVAGTIVALFGGFLLSEVLILQPSADPVQVPGAAASATTTPSARPTTTPEASSAADYLAGLELDGKGLPLGVFRVTGDGERRFPRYSQDAPGRERVSDVAVTPDGDVWVMRAAARAQSDTLDRVRVVRLGKPGTVLEDEGLPRSTLTGLRTRSDGLVGVTSGPDGVRVFDGLGWTEETSAYDLCRWGLVELGPGAATPDGACWASTAGGELLRIEPDGTTTSVSVADVGSSPDSAIHGVTVDAMGTVWAAVSGSDGFEALASYDGQAWTSIPFEGDPGPSVKDVAVSPGGVAWITLFDRQEFEIFVASWDGEAWAVHGPVKRRTLSVPPGTHFLSEDSIWFASGMVFFDGTSLREGVFLVERQSSFGPDGLAWTTTLGDGYGLYVITPEAMVASG